MNITPDPTSGLGSDHENATVFTTQQCNKEQQLLLSEWRLRATISRHCSQVEIVDDNTASLFWSFTDPRFN